MIEVGQKYSTGFAVDNSMTADRYGNEGFMVLATPYLAAAFEKCTVEMLEPHLDNSAATVGTRLEIDHLAPTPVGAKVSIDCELVAVEKSKLTFRLEAADPSGVVARCVHHRAIIDRVKFLKRFNATI